MNRLDAMTAFAAVADRSSFAAAARHLQLSPPAITRLIAGLEQHLGVALLRRTTRSVTLTDAGARYLERIRSVLSEVEEAESAAEAEQATPAGRLPVRRPVTVGRLPLGPFLPGDLKH